MRVRSLGREDPLEEGMTTHSSIFAWRIPWTEEPEGLQSVGLQRAGHDWRASACTHTMEEQPTSQRVQMRSFQGAMSPAGKASPFLLVDLLAILAGPA